MDADWTSLETHTGCSLSIIYVIYDNVYHNWTKNIIMRMDSPPLLFRPSFCQRPAFLLNSCISVEDLHFIHLFYFISLMTRWIPPALKCAQAEA